MSGKKKRKHSAFLGYNHAGLDKCFCVSVVEFQRNKEEKYMDGRALTDGEIALAKSVYGKEINYGKVKIFNRKWAFFQPRNRAMAPNGNIYYAPDNSDYSVDFSINGDIHTRATFIHEMAHVICRAWILAHAHR